MKRALITFVVLMLFVFSILAVKHYKPFVDKSACVGCEDCVKACPVKAIEVVDEKAEIQDTLCIDCKICVKTCPHHAIRTTK